MVLQKLAGKLKNYDLFTGTRWTVEVDGDASRTLVFYKRKDAELYKKSLRLSTSNVKSTIKKLALDNGYILD